MNITAILSFLGFTLSLAVLSWYKSRKNRARTVSDFFMANKNLSFVFIGSGLLFSNINTATIVGENELAFTGNMSIMAWGITSVLAMLIVSEFLVPNYLKLGIATTPDFLSMRYSPEIGKAVSVIFLLSYVVNLLPSVLYGGAIAFDGLFHISELLRINYTATIWILVWVIGAAGGLYAVIGGLRAITVSDTFLGLGFFAGGIILPVFALKYVGRGNVLSGLSVVLSKHTDHLNSIGSATDPIPFSTLFTGMLLVNLYYWGTEQYIIQQVLSSRDLKNSQKGITLACFGKLISPLLLNIPGVIAVHIFSKLKNPAEVFPRLNSLTAPPALAGYIAAIVFGTALSTFNAGLNSSSTLFILNIYKPAMKKKGRVLPESDLLRKAKLFEIAICLAAMFIAPFILLVKNGFYAYVQIVNGFFNVPIFTILIIGLLTKRVPAIAAKIGLVFFITIYAFTQLIFNTHIHFLHILAILFLLTSALMLIIGKFFPAPNAFHLKQLQQIDAKPWKYRHFYSMLLIMMMIGVFLVFSRFGLAK
ncbi:solute:sodium symporter family transporter [Mucilaginibacter flavus]|uniref:solute:sodium symporter family transporter n=1 Tax=Mucilaginibacter flavus TaxID=931504 RepID=UPI0025B3FFD4|nr:solute:sodium symporter family transporter [Mucilaginibacter flavus]MDN3580746.1 solute:sodium symporter family transporter [Mucilaginibacter flavus]